LRSVVVHESIAAFEQDLPADQRVYVSPDGFHILEVALDALQEQERQRIEHMRDGIAAAKGASCRPRPA
jgi:hypothetical protein